MAVLYRSKDCLPWSVSKFQSALVSGVASQGPTFRVQLALWCIFSEPLMYLCEDLVSFFCIEEGDVMPHQLVGPENSLH